MDKNISKLNINAEKQIYILMKKNGIFLCQFTGVKGPRWSEQIGQALQAETTAAVVDKARRIAETVARRRENSGTFYGADRCSDFMDRYRDFRDVGVYHADVRLHEGELVRVLPGGLHYLREDFVSARTLTDNGQKQYLGFSTAETPRLAGTISKAVGFASPEAARQGAQKRTISLTYMGKFKCE